MNFGSVIGGMNIPGSDPGAAPNFPAIQQMLDTYAATGMIPKKLDVNQFKKDGIVAPLQ